ncbi:MAG: GNAT family N-acetyltransferase [Sphaerochaetaceae bacterium]
MNTQETEGPVLNSMARAKAMAGITSTERAYRLLWSGCDRTEGNRYYQDASLPDMYDHNFTELPEGAPPDCIEKELALAKGRPFLKVEAPFPLSHPQGESEHLGYYVLQHEHIERPRPVDCTILPVTDTLASALSLFEIEYREDNKDDFPQRRAKRETLQYTNPESGIKCFLCFHQGKAIGKCELFLHEGSAKIEELVILDAFQRQGYGSFLLKFIINHARTQKVSCIYLVADEDDTPRQMYLRYGFEKIGEWYGLLFKPVP